MNKRLEEKLAMLAFGDMSPEETARLEREVAGNREAMLILEEYRGMRTGLKAMADIPDHQLSTERLRHAILTQGLKPKRRPQLGWLWMPAGVAVLAFGLTMMRHPNPVVMPMGSIVGGEPVAMSPQLDGTFASVTASGSILSVAQPEQPKVSPVSTESRNRRSERSRLEAMLKEQVALEFDNMISMNTHPTNNHPSTALAAETTATKAQPASSPIVLIDSSKDKSTGAQKATEVDSASNVVVGG